MIWADKLTIVLYILAVCLGMAIDGHPSEFTPIIAIFAFKYFVPLWLFLRFLDWATGIQKRRNKRRLKIIDSD